MIDLSLLPKCGPKRIDALKSCQFQNTQDLISKIPRKYEDRRFVTPFGKWEDGGLVICGGTISHVESHSYPKERLLIELDVENGPSIQLVFFGKMGGFMAKKYTEGKTVTAIGQIQLSRGYQMVHPELSLKSIHNYKGEYLPVYSIPERVKDAGVSQNLWTSWVTFILKTNSYVHSDPLSQIEKSHFNLIEVGESLKKVHQPKTPTDVAQGLRNLKYMELIPVVKEWIHRQGQRRLVGESNPVSLTSIVGVISKLPFELTNAQNITLNSLFDGLSKDGQFSAILQADVGAGKTVIANLSALAVSQFAGSQVAIMAPTEVLARQLHQDLIELSQDLCVDYLSGSVKGQSREEVLIRLKLGETKIIVGTHALFQASVEFHHLRYVIIDEQHRFGVNQRESLLAKGDNPDLLMMTATPIPRSLLQTVYGDLDVLTMKGKPPGRLVTKTHIVPELKRAGMLDYLKKYLQKDGRVYWVLPRIESDELASVESRGKELKQYFSGHEVKTLHGKLGDEDKLNRLSEFRNGEVQLLVATTVIEVGVNIPEANIMCIENAEQFGLSQLHQLRGRVGRGGEESWCFLMSENEEAKERLEQFCETDDGFEIAELDLKLRGAGDLNGYLQSGMSPLRFVDYLNDIGFIQETIKKVSEILSK